VGLGRAENPPPTLPAQHHGNARGIDLKKWIQHIKEKAKC
jgi:hypothetical protein